MWKNKSNFCWCWHSSTFCFWRQALGIKSQPSSAIKRFLNIHAIQKWNIKKSLDSHKLCSLDTCYAELNFDLGSFSPPSMAAHTSHLILYGKFHGASVVVRKLFIQLQLEFSVLVKKADDFLRQGKIGHATFLTVRWSGCHTICTLHNCTINICLSL